jgi:hypothetical protein
MPKKMMPSFQINRERETSNVNEEVDTYLHHLSNVDITSIECPLEWWGEINQSILMLRLEREKAISLHYNHTK